MNLNILGLPVAVGARHSLVDDSGIPVLRVEHNAGHVLEIQATVRGGDLADQHGWSALEHATLGLRNLALPRGLAIATANEEDVIALSARRGGNVVHLELEMAEDQSGLLRLRDELAKRVELRGRVSPVIAHVEASVLSAHRLDVNLRVADKHLDAQVQLQDARRGEVILHCVLQTTNKGREEVALLFTEERQVVPIVLRGRGHLVLKECDGPAQDNAFGQNPEGRVDGVTAEPVRQVLEVRDGILNWRPAEDPLSRCTNGTKRGVAPGLLAVADVVALIKHDAVPRIVVDDVLIAPHAIVGRQKDDRVTRSTPRALRELAKRNSTLLERGRPLLDENRGCDEQSRGDRSVT